MKKFEKLLEQKNFKIILSAVVVVLLLVPFLLFKNNGSNKISKNDDKDIFAHTDAEIVRDEEFNNLKISNITMITNNGYTTFTADVTNTAEEPTDFENINIELKDKDGNVIIVLLGNIGSGLKHNETRTISASAKGEFKNVSSKSISAYGV